MIGKKGATENGDSPRMYMRVVSVKLAPGKLEAFKKLYTEATHPGLPAA